MSLFGYVCIDKDDPFKCIVPDGLAVHKDDLCIVKIGDILDVGRVDHLEDTEGHENAGSGMPSIVRCATLQDQTRADENSLMSKMAMDKCLELSAKHGLKIRFIRVRYSFNRKALMVVFVAEERIDYREMVRELASELQTRIDMKQVGVRDEAGMIGGLGPCGRNLCCCTWLHKFASINVKMAKVQRLSLNPAAISGMCSRLKCCLRYEYEQYREADQKLPRDGERVKCCDGSGHVCGKDILSGRIKVRLDEGRIMEYSAGDINRGGSEKKQPMDIQETDEQVFNNDELKWDEQT